jgi:hypothetical protein
MSTFLFTRIEGESYEAFHKRWIAYENERFAKIVEQGCSVCGEKNLEEYLCPNCQGDRECTNCCGCYELEENGIEE